MTDADDGDKAAYDLPSPSKAGAIEASAEQDGNGGGKGDELSPEEIAARVGWPQQFGWNHESALEGESMLDHQTWLEGNLADKFYGDWYHNAAVICFVRFSFYSVMNFS